jgi:hypothetical protein
MEVLSWCCTVLILLGYILNSIQKTKFAIMAWCAGDLGWIIYDIHINNLSHATLSLIIILINVFGIYKLLSK